MTCSRQCLERLQKEAHASELDFTNTTPAFFLTMSALQLIVTQFLGYLISPHVQTLAALGIFSHWLGFTISYFLNTTKWLDFMEDVSILCMLTWSYSAINAPSRRQRLVYFCSTIWCLRLMIFVVYRVIVRGSDWRFDKLQKGRAYSFFGWTSGGTWCWLNFLSVWLLFDLKDSSPLSTQDFTGLYTFIIGLAIETIADVQKYQHNFSYKSGKNPLWISSGLWKFSRHPNYVGEVLLTFGTAIICSSGCFQTGQSWHCALCCFISPLWSFWFLFFTSLMLLEKRADKKWGGQKAYEQYKRNTPVFI